MAYLFINSKRISEEDGGMALTHTHTHTTYMYHHNQENIC